MNKKVQYKGQFRVYIMWPLYAAILLLVLDIVLFTQNITCGIVGVAFTLVYGVCALIFLLRKQPLLTKAMVEFAADYAQVQKTLLEDFKVPYGLIDESGKVIWLNHEFKNVLQKANVYRKNITTIFQGIDSRIFDTDENEFSADIIYDERDYRVDFKKLAIDSLMEDNSLLNVKNVPALMAVYLFDETDIKKYIQQLHDERIVVGLIYIDNYDEALESIDELRRSLLAGLVERKISKYITNGNGIVKKLEKDKYLLVFNYKYLEELRADKFSILEEVRTTDIGNSMAVTLSIGVAAGYDNFNKNYEMARAAIDLALGRGGDQTVVKEGDQTTFFGGKSTTVEKNTRVKARVKAHALRELIEVADNVIIMGHKISDADALGAAIGIYRASKALNKHANIVLNDVTRSLRPTVETFTGVPEYEEDLFIRSSEAMQYVSDNTLLVVVDVNRPGYTECPELVERCRTIVVLDHHRQSGDTINHAVLSYIEPYASSTCEMVAEILQYIGDNVKLKSAEANAIYAGIIVDTNNFTNKAGVRTFEAAAFIRRSGADIIKVRKLLRDDMNEYKARAEAVRHAEVYRDSFALAVCPSANLESPTIVGAQAANELLNINGVKASIVFTYFNNEVYLSARSIDEVNVQLIMEKLGGGGHMTIAGAQLKDVTVDEAIELVKKTLDGMIEEGEI